MACESKRGGHPLRERGPVTDSFVDDVAAYAKVGIETMIVMPPGDAPGKYVEEVVAPLVPKVADL